MKVGIKMEIDKKLIGNKIRLLRESKGWTQEDLGLKIGMKQSNVATIEKGRKFISMDKVYKILEVFNISFDYLFKDVLIALQNSEADDLFHTTLKSNLSVMKFEDLKMTKRLIQKIYNSPQFNSQEQEPPQ